jgi:hypothetical protein
MPAQPRRPRPKHPGGDDAGAHARHAARTSQLLPALACQLTLPPCRISCQSFSSSPSAAANHKASPIESLIASAPPQAKKTCEKTCRFGGGRARFC